MKRKITVVVVTKKVVAKQPYWILVQMRSLRKNAYAVLGTESEKLIKSWGLSVEIHYPKTYSYTQKDNNWWDGSARQAVYEAICFGVGFRD